MIRVEVFNQVPPAVHDVDDVDILYWNVVELHHTPGTLSLQVIVASIPLAPAQSDHGVKFGMLGMVLVKFMPTLSGLALSRNPINVLLVVFAVYFSSPVIVIEYLPSSTTVNSTQLLVSSRCTGPELWSATRFECVVVTGQPEAFRLIIVTSIFSNSPTVVITGVLFTKHWSAVVPADPVQVQICCVGESATSTRDHALQVFIVLPHWPIVIAGGVTVLIRLQPAGVLPVTRHCQI